MGEKEDPIIPYADQLRTQGITPNDIREEDPEAANMLGFVYGLADEAEETSAYRKRQKPRQKPQEQPTIIDPDFSIPDSVVLTSETPSKNPIQTSFLPPPYENPERMWGKTHNSNGKKK
jgi:hypothetical protein